MPDAKHPTVLLVEDDETDILLFKRLAARHEIEDQIEIVENAEEALGLLRGKTARAPVPPVVVVTDLNMPGMTGHELIDDIRSTPELERTIIFVVSTSDLKSDIERAYANRVAGYIIKDTAGRATENCVQMLRHYCKAVVVEP